LGRAPIGSALRQRTHYVSGPVRYSEAEDHKDGQSPRLIAEGEDDWDGHNGPEHAETHEAPPGESSLNPPHGAILSLCEIETRQP
jgi:hypothetical protein